MTEFGGFTSPGWAGLALLILVKICTGAGSSDTSCLTLIDVDSDLTVTTGTSCLLDTDARVKTLTIRGSVIVTSRVHVNADVIFIGEDGRITVDATESGGQGKGSDTGSGGLTPLSIPQCSDITGFGGPQRLQFSQGYLQMLRSDKTSILPTSHSTCCW